MIENEGKYFRRFNKTSLVVKCLYTCLIGMTIVSLVAPRAVVTMAPEKSNVVATVEPIEVVEVVEPAALLAAPKVVDTVAPTEQVPEKTDVVVDVKPVETPKVVEQVPEKTVEAPVVEPEPLIEENTNLPLTNAEIDLIALVTMAEAEGESEQGKRLVISTILNRVDDPRFPNTVNGVVYQRNAFEVITNGRIDRCYVSESIRELVISELHNRSNREVVYFRAGCYSSYGTPLFQVGNHYFSAN